MTKLYIYSFSYSFPISWDIECSSLFYTVGPCCLSILHVILPVRPSPTLPSPWQPQICLSVSLFLFHRFICTIFYFILFYFIYLFFLPPPAHGLAGPPDPGEGAGPHRPLSFVPYFRCHIKVISYWYLSFFL